jgi:hypothetical protein
MWALVVTVSLPLGKRPDQLREDLTESAVPATANLSSLVDATWTLSEDGRKGIGFYRFTSRDAAHARASGVGIGDAAPGGATVIDVEVLEVLVDITG